MNKHHGREHPCDGGRTGGQQTERRVGQHGLGALGETGREPQRALVAERQPPLLDERRERELRHVVEQVRGQEHAAGQPRCRHGHRDTDDEPPVDHEVCGEVLKAAEVGRAAPPRQRAVETIQHAVDQPQCERDRPCRETRRHARADADEQCRRRQMVGTQAARVETRRRPVQRPCDPGTNRAVKHAGALSPHDEGDR